MKSVMLLKRKVLLKEGKKWLCQTESYFKDSCRLSGIGRVLSTLPTTALRIYLTKRLITILLVIFYQINFSDEGTKVVPDLQCGYPSI